MSLRMMLGAVGAAGTIYRLTGSAGAPNQNSDSQTSPTDATVSWIFNTDGTVDKKTAGSTVQFQAGLEWVNVSPPVDIWIQFTLDSGPDNPSGGDALTTWHALVGAGSANRSFVYTETTDGFADLQGVIKVELSTDASGVTIVATGYYRGLAAVEL